MKCGEDCHRQPWWCFTPEQQSGFLSLLPFSVVFFFVFVFLLFAKILCCWPSYTSKTRLLVASCFNTGSVFRGGRSSSSLRSVNTLLLPTLFCSSVFALNNQTEVSDLVMSTILNCGSDFLWTMSGSKSIYWSPEFHLVMNLSKHYTPLWFRWFFFVLVCLKIFSFEKPNAHKIILSLSFVSA